MAAGPQSASLHYNYANAQRQLGAHALAIESYRTALLANPDFDEASLNLTATLLDVAEFAEAERVVRAAIERAPQAASLKLSLGCVLVAAGRLNDALGPLDQASLAGLVDARHKLGRAFFALGRLDKAKRTLERVVLDAPADANVRTDLGVILLALNANAEAVRRFRESVARAPDHAEAHANLAEALRRTNALPEAISHGERAA